MVLTSCHRTTVGRVSSDFDIGDKTPPSSLYAPKSFALRPSGRCPLLLVLPPFRNVVTLLIRRSARLLLIGLPVFGPEVATVPIGSGRHDSGRAETSRARHCSPPNTTSPMNGEKS